MDYWKYFSLFIIKNILINKTELALPEYNFIYAIRWTVFEILRSKVDVAYGFLKLKEIEYLENYEAKNKIKWYLNREIDVRSKNMYTWLVWKSS